MSKFKDGDNIRLVSQVDSYSNQLKIGTVYKCNGDSLDTYVWYGRLGYISIFTPNQRTTTNSYWIGDFEIVKKRGIFI